MTTPTAYRIDPATHTGYAHLRVRDLTRATEFYTEMLGLQLQGQSAGQTVLGANGRDPVVILTADASAQPKPRRSTGLYHIAIRVPTREELARVFAHLVLNKVELHGFSDHAVSEALYLDDPDGNGLELYHDRPRANWPISNGQVDMLTQPVDVYAMLALGQPLVEPWRPLDAATDLGHVHLHVSDLAQAERFYVDVLGLEVTQRTYQGALFMAAGGYHHHLGANIWAGQNAPRPPAHAVGLIAYSYRLPDQPAVQAAADRAQAAGLEVVWEGEVAVLHDFDGNRVELLAEGVNPFAG